MANHPKLWDMEIDSQFKEQGINNTYSAEKMSITPKQLYKLNTGSAVNQNKFLKRMSDILEIDNEALNFQNSNQLCISRSWEKLKIRLQDKV